MRQYSCFSLLFCVLLTTSFPIVHKSIILHFSVFVKTVLSVLSWVKLIRLAAKYWQLEGGGEPTNYQYSTATFAM